MGRHAPDPVPLRDKILDSGPMKRIRSERDTEPIPSAEVKRRAWPAVALLGGVMASAGVLSVVLGNLSAEESPTRSRSFVSDTYSPEPDPSPSPSRSVRTSARPKVTVTKNQIEYVTKAPKPGPTVMKTIYVTPPPKTITVPGPKITVRVTIKPKPAPTKTITRTEIVYEDRCFRVRNGAITGEIACP